MFYSVVLSFNSQSYKLRLQPYTCTDFKTKPSGNLELFLDIMYLLLLLRSLGQLSCLLLRFLVIILFLIIEVFFLFIYSWTMHFKAFLLWFIQSFEMLANEFYVCSIYQLVRIEHSHRFCANYYFYFSISHVTLKFLGI